MVSTIRGQSEPLQLHPVHGIQCRLLHWLTEPSAVARLWVWGCVWSGPELELQVSAGR